MQNDHAVHGDPIWRERANYILDAVLVGEDLPKHFEQLWTRQVGDNEFEICCIPFFLYDIALGDIVSSRTDGSGLVERVVRHSGRYVFRAILNDLEAPFDDVIAWIAQRGGLIEWSSRSMIAIDAVDEVAAQQLADYLADLEAQGRLVYETGRS
ncbi:MAG: DUF4265 domain-containing protein [Janthinobacterium lividum]